jgi:DNA-binding beta-propeller fold protein YncE
MSLKFKGFIELPENRGDGGFDHAAIHLASDRLYVAHTANSAVDIVSCATDKYLASVTDLEGVAGVLISEERNLVFTSNRAEDKVGIFHVGKESEVRKVSVGHRPNGLAFDSSRGLLLVANVGDPKMPSSTTLSFVDAVQKSVVAQLLVPGRTRWTLYDHQNNQFYVNIADPPQIVVIKAGNLSLVSETIRVPGKGPHGLELDPAMRRLFCACDDGKLITLELPSGKVQSVIDLSGPPDVIFFNQSLGHLYVAIGTPGVIDVIDTEAMKRIHSEPTEKGAHTIAFNPKKDKVYAFLPGTHRAAVFQDRSE